MALIVRGRWKSRNGVTDWITQRERDGKTKVTRRCRGDVKEGCACVKTGLQSGKRK